MVEALKGLTPRLADSQSNLKPLAASAIAELASSLTTDAGTKVCMQPNYIMLCMPSIVVALAITRPDQLQYSTRTLI